MMRQLSPLRVARRPDFEALDLQKLPEDAPTRTEDGRPWVRWAKQGEYSGWYAVGSRKPQRGGTPTFWEALFLVACECAGGTFDQVHCCGRSVLALGGLGVTMRSGYAQLLLHCCLLANPARYVEVMAPLLQASGAYTRATTKSPSGVALYQDGEALLTEEKLRHAVMLGSDSLTWTNKQKDQARLWVSCCSELLRDETMDKAQMTFLQEVAPALVTEETLAAIKWPRSGARDWWQYTPQLRAVWALAFVLALEDERQTERLIVDAVEGVKNTPDAPMGMEHVLERMRSDVRDPSYDEPFRARFDLADRLLMDMLRVPT